MSMSKPNIIILGRSGSGKGTQAKLLAKEFDLEYIETGNLLRTFAGRDNPASKKIKHILAEGELAPSWLTSFIWMEKLVYTPPKKGVLFDGSPRKLQEAHSLDEVLDWFDRKNSKVVLLDISYDEAYRRIMNRRVCSQCGKSVYMTGTGGADEVCQHCFGKLAVRIGDHAEAIKTRLAWFEDEVVPVIEHYRKKGVLVTVNGEQSIPDIQKEIIEKLNLISFT